MVTDDPQSPKPRRPRTPTTRLPQTSLLVDVEIPFPCPECGEETERKLGAMHADPHFTCGHCGAIVHVEADELEEITREVEADILEQVRKAGYKINTGTE